MQTPKRTEEQVNYVIANYEDLGVVETCNRTGLTKTQVTKIRNKFGLKVKTITRGNLLRKTRIEKPPKNYKFEEVTNINNPNVCYLLGLLWADGYIHEKRKRISMNILETDFSDVETLFFSLARWYRYTRNRPNRKPVCDINIYGDKLSKWFLSFGYGPNTSGGADKLLSMIPKDNLKYWFRGLIDGDGCFYINENNNSIQFSLASCYNQDWGYFTKLLDMLSINYKIIQNQTRHGDSSIVRITNRFSIIKLGGFLYSDYDFIGFSRKYNKYLQIVKWANRK